MSNVDLYASAVWFYNITVSFAVSVVVSRISWGLRPPIDNGCCCLCHCHCVASFAYKTFTYASCTLGSSLAFFASRAAS